MMWFLLGWVFFGFLNIPVVNIMNVVLAGEKDVRLFDWCPDMAISYFLGPIGTLALLVVSLVFFLIFLASVAATYIPFDKLSKFNPKIS